MLLGEEGKPIEFRMCGPDAHARRFYQAMKHTLDTGGRVRILIKHDPSKCLLPWLATDILQHPKILKGLTSVHFWGLARVTGVPCFQNGTEPFLLG